MVIPVPIKQHSGLWEITLMYPRNGLCNQIKTLCIGVRVAFYRHHHGDVIMDAIASQITSLTIVYSIVYSDADQRKHQSSASLAFVRGIHRGPVNSPHKWPVTRKMFPFDDVIMIKYLCNYSMAKYMSALK